MHEQLTQLRKITDELPELDQLVRRKTNNIVEYECEVGECSGQGLFNCEEVSVQRAFMKKGTIFPKHRHDANELLVLYTGKIKVTNCESSEIVEAGRFAFFEKDALHSVEALEDTWLIGIAIPAIGGYPDA